jgi:hypothetical protein
MGGDHNPATMSPAQFHHLQQLQLLRAAHMDAGAVGKREREQVGALGGGGTPGLPMPMPMPMPMPGLDPAVLARLGLGGQVGAAGAGAGGAAGGAAGGSAGAGGGAGEKQAMLVAAAAALQSHTEGLQLKLAQRQMEHQALAQQTQAQAQAHAQAQAQAQAHAAQRQSPLQTVPPQPPNADDTGKGEKGSCASGSTERGSC